MIENGRTHAAQKHMKTAASLATFDSIVCEAVDSVSINALAGAPA